jgi:hypothetical protein
MMLSTNEKGVGARFIAPTRLPHLWGKAVPRYPDFIIHGAGCI